MADYYVRANTNGASWTSVEDAADNLDVIQESGVLQSGDVVWYVSDRGDITEYAGMTSIPAGVSLKSYSENNIRPRVHLPPNGRFRTTGNNVIVSGIDFYKNGAEGEITYDFIEHSEARTNITIDSCYFNVINSTPIGYGIYFTYQVLGMTITNCVFNNMVIPVQMGASSSYVSTNLVFVNNTIYNCTTGVRVGKSTNAKVENNIFCNNTVGVNIIGTLAGTVVMDYNLFHSCGTNYSDGRVGDHDKTKDPKFVSLISGMEDFRIYKSSFGVKGVGPSLDATIPDHGLDGVVRSGAITPMGAYATALDPQYHRNRERVKKERRSYNDVMYSNYMARIQRRILNS